MTKNTFERAVLDGDIPIELAISMLDSVLDSNGCDLFQGKVYAGYGRLYYKGLMTSAHRLAWTLQEGEIPDYMTLDHRITCPRHCIRINHLEVCSRAENARRAGLNRVNRAGVSVIPLKEYHQMQEKSTRPTLEQLRAAVDF